MFEDKIACPSEASNCQRCHLSQTRQNVVWARGNPRVGGIMLVGEAPGADEDAQGSPFVGRAGQLLNKLLEKADLANQVYITNLVKCRPPQNRVPMDGEIGICKDWLEQQIVDLDPFALVLLGATAARAFEIKGPISQIRGYLESKVGFLLMPTFHPAYLLRNPDAESDVIRDLKAVKRAYEKHLAPDIEAKIVKRSGGNRVSGRIHFEAAADVPITELMAVKAQEKAGYPPAGYGLFSFNSFAVSDGYQATWTCSASCD